MFKLSQIDQQIAELNKQREMVLNEERRTAVDQIKALIKRYGLTASDLSLRAGRGSRIPKAARPVTFRDPQTGKTWDGTLAQKGRKPDWIVAKIKDGTIERYRA